MVALLIKPPFIIRMAQHPNISPILSVEVVEGNKTGMITPLVHGKNLQQIIFEGVGSKVC